MLFNMWSTGELKREIKVFQQKVYMKITRPLASAATPVCIELNNAHIYYPSGQADFYEYLPVFSALTQKLQLPDDMSTVKRFIEYVQDGFDEMFSKYPEEDDRERQVLGEVSATFGDMKIQHEVSR